jgi:hypothetical protein
MKQKYFKYNTIYAYILIPNFEEAEISLIKGLIISREIKYKLILKKF